MISSYLHFHFYYCSLSHQNALPSLSASIPFPQSSRGVFQSINQSQNPPVWSIRHYTIRPSLNSFLCSLSSRNTLFSFMIILQASSCLKTILCAIPLLPTLFSTFMHGHSYWFSCLGSKVTSLKTSQFKQPPTPNPEILFIKLPCFIFFSLLKTILQLPFYFI